MSWSVIPRSERPFRWYVVKFLTIFFLCVFVFYFNAGSDTGPGPGTGRGSPPPPPESSSHSRTRTHRSHSRFSFDPTSSHTRTVLDNSRLCQFIPDYHEDRCNYASHECPDPFGGGLLNYLLIRYCRFDSHPILRILFYVLIFILFAYFCYLLGDITDADFCPALQCVADTLGLPDDVAGVTFLAFGNGAADIASIVVSFLSVGSAGLGVGEPLGAGVCITSFVTGTAALFSNLVVPPYQFFRDLLFYIIAVLFVLFSIINDAKIYVWESLGYLLLYAFYVLIVIFGRAINGAVLKSVEKFEVQEGHRKRERKALLRKVREEEEGGLLSPLTAHSHLHEDHPMSPSSLLKKDSFARRARAGAGKFLKRVLSHPQLKSPNPTPTSLTSPSSFSLNVIPTEEIFEIGDDGKGNELPDGHVYVTSEALADLVSSGTSDSSLASSDEFDEIPKKDWADEGELETILRANFIDDTGKEDDPMWELEELPTKVPCCSREWWGHVLMIPWHMLTRETRWKERGLFQKIVLVIDWPVLLIRRLTIPKATREDWSKFFAVLSSFFFPWFLAVVITQDPLVWVKGVPLMPILLLIGLILAVCVGLTTRTSGAPVFQPWFIAIAFITSVAWIYFVANEVVNILVSLGLIFHISESILGTTVLAVGNSIGDLFADVTVARNDKPEMALAACYAGPMLNLLIGLGIAVTFSCLINREWYLNMGAANGAKLNIQLIMTFAFLSVSLLTTLLVVPLSRFKFTKFHGLFLLGLYVLFLSVGVLIDMKILFPPVLS